MYEKKNFTHGKSSGVDIAAKSFDDRLDDGRSTRAGKEKIYDLIVNEWIGPVLS